MNWRRPLFGTVLFVATALYVFHAPLSGGQSQASASDGSDGQPSRAINVDVDLVLVNVSVIDSRNRFVQGLSKKNFRVWEDKIEQEITVFEREDTPVSLGIVIDKSGSMGLRKPRSTPAPAPSGWQTLVEEARASAFSCLRGGLLDDEYFLIEFSDSTQVVADFTNDLATLRDKLLFLGAGGSTSLWDAVYAGVAKLRKAKYSRKALLVLTDGEENSSRYSLGDVKRELRESDVRIYTMDNADVQFDGLQQLVKLSGGMNFRGIEPCKRLFTELRNQYIIGYRSTNRAADGEWREIRVRTNADTLPKEMGELSVRARAGYYASR